MKHMAIAALAALALAGCSGSQAEPVNFATIIQPEVLRSQAPPECSTAGDPKWQELPAGDVTRDVAARNLKANKNSFRRIGARRKVCGAALKALGLL